MSNHMRKDAIRSERIRVGVTRSGDIDWIPDLFYSRMQVTVPYGPWRHVVPPPFNGVAGQKIIPVASQVMAQQPSSQPVQQQQQQHQQHQQPTLSASSTTVHLRPFIIGPATPPATLSPPDSFQAHATDAASGGSASPREDHSGVVDAAVSDQLHLAPCSGRRDWVSEGDKDEQMEEDTTAHTTARSDN